MGQFTALSAHWPFLLTVTPLFGAALAAVQGRRGVAAARQSAIVNSTLSLIAALVMTVQFSALTTNSEQSANVRMASRLFQVELPVAADRVVRVQVSFGVDGISLAPLLIVAVAGWIAICAADYGSRDWSALSYVGLLIGQSLGFAMFAAQDALMFLIAGELWCWWLFAMTGRHGGPERRVGARQLLIAGWLAHAFWSLAIIGLAACGTWIQTALSGSAPETSFQFQDILIRQSRRILSNEAALRVWLTFQTWIVPLWLAGLCVRWPLVPFHAWWPSWLSQARIPVAILGSAVLLLEAAYVWFRYVAPFGYSSVGGWTFPLSLWAGAGLLWCGCSAVGQTDPRRLIGMLSLGSLHLALVGLILNSVAGELSAVQMLGSLAFGLITGLLCVDHAGSQRDRFAWATSLGLVGLLPAMMSFSGGLAVWMIQSRGYGITFLSTAAGSALLSWAAIQGAVRGTCTTEGVSRVDRHTGFVILPLVIAILIGLTPNWWQPVLRPAWESLHDPFSVASTSSAAVLDKDHSTTEVEELPDQPLWQSASVVWAAAGIGLLLWPRVANTSNWPSMLAAAALCGGGMVECLSFGVRTAAEWSQTIWMCALLIGLTVFTIRGREDLLSAESCGAWLLRLAAAAFAARTGDLALAGLAWELAELTRGLLSNGTRSRVVRERWRLFFSSACFWSAIIIFYALTRSTELDRIAALLAETIPRDVDGEAIGPASVLGLIATILAVSAIGCRCGLPPWSFGRDDFATSSSLLQGWLDRLIGVSLLLALIRAVGAAYGNPLCIILCISAAATAIWSAAVVAGERRVAPILNGLIVWQFSGLILLTAASSALAAFSAANVHWTQLPVARSLGGTSLSLTTAFCGVIASLAWIGQPNRSELFIEQHQGLLAKRPQQASLLMILLLGLFAAGPLWAFWPRILGLLSVSATPQRLPNDDLRTHPVLVAVAVIVVIAGAVQISKLADWLQAIALDSPISSFPRSGRSWLLVASWLAAAATVLGVIVLF